MQAFAQSRSDETQRQIDELMKAREEMIKSLLNDSGFQNFDKRFEDLMKNFEKNSFGPGTNMDGAIIGEYDWRETDTHQIFVLKVKQIKDRPLDIKIEKGRILLKGDVESIDENVAKKTKRVSKVHFERTFSIPVGVDQNNPEFENKAGELLIKFKKLKAIKDQRRPVGKDADDLTI